MGVKHKRPVAGIAKWQPEKLHRDFMQRRLEPLFSRCEEYPVSHLMMEAYMQGLKDAGQSMLAGKDSDND